MTAPNRPEPICKVHWDHEGFTGVWVDADPRPSDDERDDWCMTLARAIEDASTRAELDAAAEGLRIELGYDEAWLAGFDEPLDLAVYLYFRKASADGAPAV